MSSVARTTGSSGDNGMFYPPPLAYHVDIVNDSNLFSDTLRSFHFNLGSKFMVPVIGGEKLDLHSLYVEVTKRSDYEKVVADKKWREVVSVFNFSTTTTSASYMLRKHYLNLLYIYEQVHFFKVRGPMHSPPAGAFSGSNSLWEPDLALVEYAPEPTNNSPECNVAENGCFYAPGTIEEKFDRGYLVSLKLGPEILRGVLFHPDQQIIRPPSLAPQQAGAIVPSNPKAHRSGRRRSKRRWDPTYPKSNRSGYNFFFAETHAKLKELYPNRVKEFTKMIGQSWTSLSPDEKMVYQEIGLKDKERYKRELAEYEERMKLRRQPKEVERRE